VKIAILKERASGETRVAATPETAKKFAALGLDVAVEKGAGLAASVDDAAFAEAGATLIGFARGDACEVYCGAERLTDD